MKLASSLPLVLMVAAAASCSNDPVLDDAVDAQGNETSGVPKGEFHRAGQVCTACHVEGGISFIDSRPCPVETSAIGCVSSSMTTVRASIVPRSA
jgi:hypothetical protein